MSCRFHSAFRIPHSAFIAAVAFGLAVFTPLPADEPPGAPAGSTSSGRAPAEPGAGSARTVLPASPTAGPRRPEDEKLGERLREGTRLTDVSGSFQTAGDRISFHPDGGKGESYRVLENLALERVDRFLGQARGTPTWTVSGVITEFRGTNYLLVTKAMVKTVGDGPAAP